MHNEESALANLTHSLAAKIYKKRMCIIIGFGSLGLHLLQAKYLSSFQPFGLDASSLMCSMLMSKSPAECSLLPVCQNYRLEILIPIVGGDLKYKPRVHGNELTWVILAVFCI